MKKVIALIAVLAFASGAFAQDETLVGSFPAEGGPITVTATGGTVMAAGIDLNSAGGNLVPGAEAAPFAFFLANTPNQITYGNLGTTVNIDDGASLTLTAGAAAGTDDIVASWGRGATPVAFAVSAEGGDPPVVEPVDLTGLSMIFAPGNAIWGGQVIDGAFEVGADGFSDNMWPPAESPENVINGIGRST